MLTGSVIDVSRNAVSYAYVHVWLSPSVTVANCPSLEYATVTSPTPSVVRTTRCSVPIAL